MGSRQTARGSEPPAVSRRPRLGERATPLTQEMSEDHATQAPAARDAAHDEEAHKPTLVGPTLLFLALILVIVLLVLAPFAQQMSEKEATQAPAARDAAADQQTGKPPVLTTGFLFFIWEIGRPFAQQRSKSHVVLPWCCQLVRLWCYPEGYIR